MMRVVVAAAILALAGGVSFAGETHTLSGTLTNSRVADGTKAYVKLIGSFESCAGPGPGELSAWATFADGEASYSIDEVAEGLYTACAFIDVNGHPDRVRAESGDYASLRPVEIDDDTTVDFDEDAWSQVP